jgi:hypothetical protein
MEKEVFLKKYFPYIKWSVVALAAIVFMIVYENPFSAGNAADIVGKLSNCFAVPGVVLSGIGALSYFSSLGAYDAFGYIFSNFSLHSIIPGHHKEKYESLYEYKKEKDEKSRKWLPYALKVGLITLGISVALLVVYAFL